MKRIFKVCLLISCLIGSLEYLSAQSAEHVVIITIDGFRPDFYRDSSWPAPNLQWMAENGTSVDFVRGIFPTVTYPSHTTIATGVFPASHGIYYNSKIEDGKPAGWYYDFKDIQAETLWEAAQAEDLSTASVSWPITSNSRYIDYNIPEIWSFENPADRRGATSEYATPSGLFEEVVKNATGDLEIDEFNLSSLAMDENIGRIAAYIIRQYKPNLLTVHLPNTDGAQHRSGREGQEVRRAVAGADHAIGDIYDALAKAEILENSAIIITGDHGFVTTHTSIAPNIWLREAGLADKCFFASSGGSAFLHLTNPKDKKATSQVITMLNDLPEADKKLFRIVSKEEMTTMGANPNAVMAISAVEGISFSNAKEGDVFTQAPGGKHGYFPEFDHIHTGFVGYGGGFRSGIEIQKIGLEDIAPTAAALLGISLKAPDGMTYPGMFEGK